MAKASSKKKAWRAFAEYVRLRDSPNGYGLCISCNKPVTYPNGTGRWHAGHFYPRSVTYAALYFNEKNVNGQCNSCNTFLEGNTEMYRKGLIRKYGDGVMEELEVLKALGISKIYDFQYDAMAADYRAKSRAYKKERGIT